MIAPIDKKSPPSRRAIARRRRALTRLWRADLPLKGGGEGLWRAARLILLRQSLDQGQTDPAVLLALLLDLGDPHRANLAGA